MEKFYNLFAYFYISKNIFPIGSFFAIDNKLFHKSGGFNEEFFMYYEEAELSKESKDQLANRS